MPKLLAVTGARRKLLVLVAVTVIVAGALWWFNRAEPALPVAGECIKGPSVTTLKIVYCGSAGARYVVLGRVGNLPEEDARAVSITCAQWPDTTLVTWRERSGGKGVVICMRDA
ncbi:hypothetical protein OHA72_39545 [Dactylosporangium sp. NBC_01737]|uniref:LppU/SCO3897 family protein n=1 Tax=Dactylosporangium sp. NBC_01737 TaxID=2975959 RepID=UPI002E0FAF7D|nr:hypothetical protein OHA72_39545 [Dactylosporangium sp. NBC_01737]